MVNQLFTIDIGRTASIDSVRVAESGVKVLNVGRIPRSRRNPLVKVPENANWNIIFRVSGENRAQCAEVSDVVFPTFAIRVSR